MPVLQNLNQNKLISEKNISNKITKAENFKFNYTNDNLANYQFDINNKNKIKFKFDKNKIIVPGSSGVSNFSIKNFLWSSKEVKCRKIDTSDWKKDRREEISSISQNEN